MSGGQVREQSQRVGQRTHEERDDLDARASFVQACKRQLRERAQEARDASKATKQFAASGGAHPAVNQLHSAAKATVQAPGSFLRKRVRQKTSATSEGAKRSNKGSKRTMYDPDGLANKAQMQNSGDVHLVAPASVVAKQVSGKREPFRKRKKQKGQREGKRKGKKQMGKGNGKKRKGKRQGKREKGGKRSTSTVSKSKKKINRSNIQTYIY